MLNVLLLLNQIFLQLMHFGWTKNPSVLLGANVWLDIPSKHMFLPKPPLLHFQKTKTLYQVDMCSLTEAKVSGEGIQLIFSPRFVDKKNLTEN